MTNLGRIQHNYVVRYNQVKDGVNPNFHRLFSLYLDPYTDYILLVIYTLLRSSI